MTDNREKKLREAYANPQHRTCHECERVPTLDELIDGIKNDSVKIQSFTGRVFCSGSCWTDYLHKEGLLDAVPAT